MSRAKNLRILEKVGEVRKELRSFLGGCLGSGSSDETAEILTDGVEEREGGVWVGRVADETAAVEIPAETGRQRLQQSLLLRRDPTEPHQATRAEQLQQTVQLTHCQRTFLKREVTGSSPRVTELMLNLVGSVTNGQGEAT